MVQACVAYLDEQHCNPIVCDFEVKYTKEVEAEDGWDNNGRKLTRKDLELGIRVRFRVREDVDAVCTIFYAAGNDEASMWKGTCSLTTLTSVGPATSKFEVSRNVHALGMHAPALSVRPYEGPVFPINIAGPLSAIPELRRVRGYHKWTIWHADSRDEGRGQMYGAWRKTWITGRPFFGTASEVAELITSWEHDYGEDRPKD
jgi:hypothetical protein